MGFQESWGDEQARVPGNGVPGILSAHLPAEQEYRKERWQQIFKAFQWIVLRLVETVVPGAPWVTVNLGRWPQQHLPGCEESNSGPSGRLVFAMPLSL